MIDQLKIIGEKIFNPSNLTARLPKFLTNEVMPLNAVTLAIAVCKAPNLSMICVKTLRTDVPLSIKALKILEFIVITKTW